MRIVVKVGTSTIAHATGRLNIRQVEKLCKVLSDLKNAGHEVILVSSGAVGVVFSLVISMLHPSELDKRLGMDLEHTLPLWQRSNQRQSPQDKAD